MLRTPTDFNEASRRSARKPGRIAHGAERNADFNEASRRSARKHDVRRLEEHERNRLQ